jgi:hypothetical protein
MNRRSVPVADHWYATLFQRGFRIPLKQGAMHIGSLPPSRTRLPRFFLDQFFPNPDLTVLFFWEFIQT